MKLNNKSTIFIIKKAIKRMIPKGIDGLSTTLPIAKYITEEIRNIFILRQNPSDFRYCKTK